MTKFFRQLKNASMLMNAQGIQRHITVRKMKIVSIQLAATSVTVKKVNKNNLLNQ